MAAAMKSPATFFLQLCVQRNARLLSFVHIFMTTWTRDFRSSSSKVVVGNGGPNSKLVVSMLLSRKVTYSYEYMVTRERLHV